MDGLAGGGPLALRQPALHRLRLSVSRCDSPEAASIWIHVNFEHVHGACVEFAGVEKVALFCNANDPM